MAGVASGALLEILFALEKGSAIQKKNYKKSKDYTDAVKGKFEKFLDSITEKFEKAKENINRKFLPSYFRLNINLTKTMIEHK